MGDLSSARPAGRDVATHHPRLVSTDKSHLHLGRDLPLHSNQSSHDISLGNLHHKPQFAFRDLLHHFGDLIDLVQFTKQQSSNECNLGRSRFFTRLEV